MPLEVSSVNDFLLECINCFLTKYLPADEGNATDYFSSKEICYLIKEHTDYPMQLIQINLLLRRLGYKYVLQDDEFRWMVRKGERLPVLLEDIV
ncbi:MAG TPA: hypothetical protein PL045_07805 [Chitinophagaceae bacterium]|nr:hypothetical protein [Chitinophagaceae bacterium]